MKTKNTHLFFHYKRNKAEHLTLHIKNNGRGPPIVF